MLKASYSIHLSGQPASHAMPCHAVSQVKESQLGSVQSISQSASQSATQPYVSNVNIFTPVPVGKVDSLGPSQLIHRSKGEINKQQVIDKT